MIIYGSRMYGRKNPVKGFGTCEHCGKYGQILSYTGRKWGHLYFIPLIPIGARTRVLKECKACKRGMHVAEKDVDATLAAVRGGTDAALAALITGEAEFDDEGAATEAAPYLANSVEILECLGAQDYLRLTEAALAEKGLDYEAHLVAGRRAAFRNEHTRANDAYSKALALRPDDLTAILSLGLQAESAGDLDGARANYERAVGLAADAPLPFLAMLLSIYERQKDWEALASAYEQCFELQPDLKADKATLKAYKKACKKAKR